ncbi:HAD-IIIA family hydrolase [Nocardiopsis salina]|uniref:HAD-IIIA family hydrolase n=1 Tax=Nocardiopsis salina TaxID=245836 RepID=UPI000478365F|nr:HAD-IIIA family hydrolase [Nocardiopsis salina]
MSRPEYAVVVPTTGRPALADVLQPVLDAPASVAPAEVVVVDDRPDGRNGAELPGVPDHPAVRVLSTRGGGPATARQAGWHACTAPWIAFLDDDVRPPAGWPERLCADLEALPDDSGGSQGRIVVPRPPGRNPTDAERATIALEDARWITADMAVRRRALERVGGFDTRFPRAYREDTDLVLRVQDAGLSLHRGERKCVHPLRAGGRHASMRAQRGNGDNALMRRVHGRSWRDRVAEPPGGLRSHLVTTAAAATALLAAVTGRRGTAAAAAAVWALSTARFALARMRAGPAEAAEWADMAVTSVLIPSLACWYRLRGEIRHAGAGASRGVRALLFDRDGTLVEDVPYNGDPDEVVARPGAAEAVALARENGLKVGVVTNQSGVGRGTLTERDVDRVDRRIEELLGPFDLWRVCPHTPQDGCACRKPAPGLVFAAAGGLGVHPAECAVIGDIGADLEAAAAAGARSVLVPTPVTREEERQRAPEVEHDLPSAVRRIVGGAGT